MAGDCWGGLGERVCSFAVKMSDLVSEAGRSQGGKHDDGAHMCVAGQKP